MPRMTARGEEVDRIVGLEIGADDYLPKPFNPRELLARVRAILRRETDRPQGRLSLNGVELDPGARTVPRNGVPVKLTTLEFDILEQLRFWDSWWFPRWSVPRLGAMKAWLEPCFFTEVKQSTLTRKAAARPWPIGSPGSSLPTGSTGSLPIRKVER